MEGAWAIGVDATGGNSSGRFYIPGQFVRAEDVADPVPVEDRGKVYLLLRYSGTLTNTGGITAIEDHGVGFARYTGTGQITRTIAVAQAHDFASTFGTDSAVVMELLTALPGSGGATWGVLYGVSPNSGQVENVFFRREEHTREQLWVPARLHSQLRNIHGFTDIVSTGALGYDRGGGLSPESGIAELVEEKDVLGNITTRLIVPTSLPLNSAISVLLFYKSGNEAYNTERELPLFRDASFSVSDTARYVSAVYTDDFLFTPGIVYTIKWRRAGDANDLIISSSEHMRRIIDDEDLIEISGNLQREIYEVEDRVASLENAPAGGLPTWEKVGHWDTVTASNLAMTFDANTKYANLAAVYADFRGNDNKDIAWFIRLGTRSDSPVFVRPSVETSSSYLLVAWSAHGENIEIRGTSDELRLKSNGMVYGTQLISAGVSNANPAELWVLT